MPSAWESVPGAGGPAPPPCRRTAWGFLLSVPDVHLHLLCSPEGDPGPHASPSPEAGGHLHALWPHHEGFLKVSVPLWGC